MLPAMVPELGVWVGRPNQGGWNLLLLAPMGDANKFNNSCQCWLIAGTVAIAWNANVHIWNLWCAALPRSGPEQPTTPTTEKTCVCEHLCAQFTALLGD